MRARELTHSPPLAATLEHKMSKTSKPKGGKKSKAAALTDTATTDPAKADTASQGRPSALSGEVAEYWADFQAAQPKAVHEVRLSLIHI